MSPAPTPCPATRTPAVAAGRDAALVGGALAIWWFLPRAPATAPAAAVEAKGGGGAAAHAFGHADAAAARGLAAHARRAGQHRRLAGGGGRHRAVRLTGSPRCWSTSATACSKGQTLARRQCRDRRRRRRPGARRGRRSRSRAGRGAGQRGALARPRGQGLRQSAGGDPDGNRRADRDAPASPLRGRSCRPRRCGLRARACWPPTTAPSPRATPPSARSPSPAQELFRLIRGNRLEWRAEVTAGELGRIAPGMPATLQLPGGGEVRGARAHDRADGRPADAQCDRLRRPAGRPSPAPARAGMFARGEIRARAAPSALSLPQIAVVQRDGFSYVFRVGPGDRVAQTKIGIGRRVGDRIEVTDGLAPDAAGRRRPAPASSPTATSVRVRARHAPPPGAEPAAARPVAAMNVSSWSIRNPTPAILLFVLLTLIGVMGFRAMKIQQFPDIDLPTVIVTAALPGASPAQMETDVARKLEDSIATLQGVKHIYTMVQSGIGDGHRRVPPRGAHAGGGRRRARRGVADPLVAARRPARPGGEQGQPRRLADPHLHRRLDAGWTTRRCRGSSTTRWRKRLLSVRGVGAVARVGGVDREVRVELDPASHAGARRHRGRHLAPAAPDAAGSLGRARRRRRRRAVGAHDRHRPVGRGARAHGHRALRRPPRAPRPARAGRPTPSPSSARRRCSTASRWSASRS